MKHEMPVMTEEKRQALIEDLEEVITRETHSLYGVAARIALYALKAEHAATVEVRVLNRALVSKSSEWHIPFRESCTLELYTAPPVPVMQAVDLRATLNQSMFNDDVIFGYRKAREEDITAIRTAGYEVRE